MFRVAIVDDEELLTQQYRNIVDDELNALEIEHEIRIFSDSLQFHSSCLNEIFDLVFLDIDMPKLSGITLAADLRKLNKNIGIVFVSAHNHFVFESIRYSPFRFIRKEHTEKEIPEAIRAYCHKLETEQNCIRLELENGRFVLESISNISYFYTLRHDLFYCNTQKESFRLAVRSYTMEKLEDMMAPYGFIRIHKSYLLNHSCIYQIQKDHVLLSKDNENLPLSRRRAAEVKGRYRILLREEDSI